MTYIEFQKIFGQHAVIDMRNVVTYFNGLDRRRLYEWQKKGYLRKVANGFYIFADIELDEALLKNIASQIYQPSYVGLASALAYYNFIPEAVFQTTNITTQRNKLVKTSVGDFQYRSIKRELFFGFHAVQHENRSFFISNPEKTLLDVFYFTPKSDEKNTLEGLRLNVDVIRSSLNKDRMQDYLKIFSSSTLNKSFKNLQDLIYD